MLLNLFKRKPRLVEVHSATKPTQVMTHETYVSRTLDDRRNEVERYRVGLPFRERQDRLVEKTMRRFIA
jgi:hypothetical protein